MNTERTAVFLMANLGSEVARLLAAQEKTDAVSAEHARVRAQKILADIRALQEMKTRTEELDILGKVIDDVTAMPRKYAVRDEEIKNYFMPFALRALERIQS